MGTGASLIVASQVVVTLSRIIVMIALVVLVTQFIIKLQKASLILVTGDRLDNELCIACRWLG